MSLIPALTQIVSGDADDPSRDMANWNAIRNIVNGSLDTTNLSPTAAVTAAQTTLGGTFTPWTNWTPGFTGFSVNPTVTYARYMQIGKLFILTALFAIDGTSNSTALTITGVPVASLRTIAFPLMGAANNGVFINTGYAVILASATTIGCTINHNGDVWVASGQKSPGLFLALYEVA